MGQLADFIPSAQRLLRLPALRLADRIRVCLSKALTILEDGAFLAQQDHCRSAAPMLVH